MALLARMKIQFLILLLIPKMIVSIGLAHEEIIQWWTKMSIQKPIQCQMNQKYMTAFHPIGEKFLSGPKRKKNLSGDVTCKVSEVTV